MKKTIVTLVMFLILVACSNKTTTENYLFNNETILKINEIKIEQEQVFRNGDIMSIDNIPELYFSVDDFEELYLNISSSSNDPSSYIIALPKDGKEKLCQAQVDNYLDIVATSYKDYNPTAEEMIDESMNVKLGKYLVVIISKDNEKVLKDIKDLGIIK